MKKILIVGYMGSGKSVVGKLVAKSLAIPHYDLDFLIEKHLGLSISEIFLQHGEIYFRKIEHQLFKDLVNSETLFVLSLGGGTPCYANNHLLLKSEHCTSVYLQASIETLSTRLYSERQNRPLLAEVNKEVFDETIAKHLFERSYFYHQADFKVVVNGKTPEFIANEIINLLT